jgi:hypothetical protein
MAANPAFTNHAVFRVAPFQQTGFKVDPLLESSAAPIDRDGRNDAEPSRRREQLARRSQLKSLFSKAGDTLSGNVPEQ